jgi:hypothetical protein
MSTVGLLVTVAPAALANGNVCLTVSGLCLDNPPLGNQLQVDNGNTYDVYFIGTVSGSGNPIYWFDRGSGWNSRYNGSKVYMLYEGGSLHCAVATNDSSNASAVALANCGNPTSGQDPGHYWVARGNWFVNIGTTDHLSSSGGPSVLASCGIHGCGVQAVDTNNNYPAADLEWTVN